MYRRVPLTIGIVLLIVFSGVLTAASFNLSPSGSRIAPLPFDIAGSDLDMAAAAAFTDFRLLAPGAEVDGLTLRAITRQEYEDTVVAGVRSPGKVNFVNFVYGDCVAQDDTGCMPPLQVQVWPACDRTRSDYTTGPAMEALPRTDVNLRGVPGAWFEDGRLEVYTGDITIVIFADSPNRALTAAEGLRDLNRPSIDARESLTPPIDGALEGTLSCGAA